MIPKNRDVICCYATFNQDFVLHFFAKISKYGIHKLKKKGSLKTKNEFECINEESKCR